ncbi:MAG: hypothetical protein ONB48_20245 [candidate division KSB1 bacterium]|nr:hypothetical protein [candidate division KSB1 bacterium]MDZ7276215.1 hypothetical protein [candidate division KSB1 bacterium]MDZ7287979.1 hypothetical protein [candidate division KSB1 bacterium]MDZ7300008.1 hypothetical protein [candidate division KSB1 bacterium]MDZ7308239.1 hypothetical protein [candidate division KSB1 bacterium]
MNKLFLPGNSKSICKIQVVSKTAAHTGGPTTGLLERTRLPPGVLIELERQTKESRHTTNEEKLQRMIARKSMKNTKKSCACLAAWRLTDLVAA